jgi:tyrosine-protein kinase Etk/Wzc
MRQVFQSKNTNTEEINLAKILDLFRKRWYYIVVSFVVAMIVCKLYLRYTKPIFAAEATVRVQDNKQMNQGLGMMESFGFGLMQDDIQSEIQLVQSRSMVAKTISNMKFTTLYYLVGTLVTSEIYKDDAPFVVLYDTASNVQYNVLYSLFYLAGNKFKLSYQEGPNRIEKQYYFGENIDVNGFKFQVVKRETDRYKLTPEVEYKWMAIMGESMVGRAMGGLKVEQSGYLVPILKISLQDNVPKFTSDFLNTLVDEYKLQDISRKTQAADQALQFIQNQIDTIKSSVNMAEDVLQAFKQEKEFFNVEMKIGFDLDNLRSEEESRMELLVRKLEIDRLESELKSGDTVSAVSFALEGFADQLLTSLISSYNSVVLEKKAALPLYTERHPVITELKTKQNDLMKSILINVASMRQGNDKKIQYFDGLMEKSKEQLKSLPATQRVLQSLMREFEVKEKILLTLLEKQAEAKIGKASIVSSVQIMDRALTPAFPISPNPRRIYIIGCGLGITLGLLLILIAGILKNTISYREEIETLSFTPIIGVVRRANESLNHKYPRLMSVENPKSGLSESFRSIRTNLQFLAADKKTKVVAITSTVSGEGKSFITINLAGMLSLLDIKVVIIDMDLRKPKLHYSFGHDNSVGLSTLLVGKSTLKDTLVHTEYKNLDLITSGPIPPNPSELILSQRMQDLLDDLKTTYDYILIDTPPIGLVTDGTTMLMNADVALYVIRADYSKRVFVRNPDQLAEDHNIRNLYIVFNSVSTANKRYGGYGYKVYGQGYYSEDHIPPKWWEVWKFFRRKS